MRSSDVVMLAFGDSVVSHRIFHSEPRRAATAAGTRIAFLSALTWNVTRESIIRASESTNKLAERLGQAKPVSVTTRKGTSLNMNVKGRKPIPITGILEDRGALGSVPDYAEATISPVEGSSEGVLIADGSTQGVGRSSILSKLLLSAGESLK